MSIKIKIKKLNPNAVLPSYAKEGDAAMDLTATSRVASDAATHSYVEYGTGLAMEIPKGFVGLIFPRSSVSETTLSLANCVGVIDSGYRGEVKCRFKEVSNEDGWGRLYNVGERVAQLIVLPYPEMEIEEVEELSNTARGEGAFGSSGK